MSSSTVGCSKLRTGSSAQGWTPEERVKALANNAMVDINPAVKAICYVRTGKEMIRSAENYMDDGLLDNAYLLYMRFLTLFVEKIKEHPGYKDLGEADKKLMRSYCKKVLPLAEQVKAGLLAKYEEEYKICQKETEQLKAKLEEERRREDEERKKRVGSGTGTKQFDPFHVPAFTPSAPPSYQQSLTLDRDYKNPLPGYNIAGEYDSFPSSNGTALNPQFDRTTKPSRLLSPLGSDSLRQVVIPTDVISKFLALAAPNTAKNVETCGILAGKIIRDQLVMSHLIIPKQSGTPDSCTTDNEEQIYLTIDRYNLIQLGWIHTHPTQTSFLSSVDLHTHLPYQLMMPESIAIVCAPSYRQHDVFTLTQTGIDLLQSCSQSGFHPHPAPAFDEPYFMAAAHASFTNTLNITVEDVRKF